MRSANYPNYALSLGQILPHTCRDAISSRDYGYEPGYMTLITVISQVHFQNLGQRLHGYDYSLGVAECSGVLLRENVENWRSPDTIFSVLDHIFPPFVRGKIGRYDFTQPDTAAYAARRIFTRPRNFLHGQCIGRTGLTFHPRIYPSAAKFCSQPL